MPRITLTLPRELAAALRAEAVQDDRPMSSVARQAFAHYFAGQARSQPRPQRRAGPRSRSAATIVPFTEPTHTSNLNNRPSNLP